MDITELKAIIDANIFENTSQAITGDALNDVLNLIADSLGEYVPVADIFDESGTIRSALLPSYVDDVLEFSTRDDFPAVGEGGKIYLAADTNLSYRWGGSEYVIIAQSLALGETSSTAYRGDRGKIAYDHSQTSHRLSIAGMEVSSLGGSIDSDALALALSIPELRNAVVTHTGNSIIHITAAERIAWNKIASYFYIDEATGNLVTDRNVIIRKNLTVGGDTSTGGKGEDTGVSGTVTGIRVDANTILEPTNGIVDMSDVLANIDVDLSNYYTKQETISEIAKAVDDLNLGQYAKASELATLQTEVDNIEAVLGMDEEAAGIINTWEEVKAFLDGYSSSDDLATILSAMNADIAKRALASDLNALARRVGVNELTIADNAGNIKNNFDAIKALGTSKADKATTLAGYGITDAYTEDEIDGKVTAINNAIALKADTTALEALAVTVGDNTTNIRNLKASVYTKSDLAAYKSWWDDLMSLIVKEGNDIKIKTNLIVTGDTTTGGTGSDAGTSGTVIGVMVNGQSYEDETNGMLDLSTLMNQYALTSAIPSLEGYAKIADVSAALAGYQPLITASNKLDYSLIANTPGLKSLAFKDSLAVSEVVGLQSALNNKQDAATAITTSNIGSQSVNYATSAGSAPASDVYAWAKASTKPSYSFGEITSKPTTISGYGITDALTTSNYNSYSPKLDGTGANGTWGINISGNAATLGGLPSSRYLTLDTTYYTDNTNADTLTGVSFYINATGNGSGNSNFPTTYGKLFSWGGLYAYTQLYADVLNKGLYFRTKATAFSGEAWKEIAFLDSNVASASKWANARTITLTGSVTGSVSIDGSANVTLATTTNHTHTFASLAEKPTTISGYGITDAYTTSTIDSKLSGYLPLSGGTLSGDLKINNHLTTFSSTTKGGNGGNAGTIIKGLNYTHSLWLIDGFDTTEPYAVIRGGYKDFAASLILNEFSGENTISKTTVISTGNSHFGGNVIIGTSTNYGSGLLQVEGDIAIHRLNSSEEKLVINVGDVAVNYKGYDLNDGFVRHNFYSNDYLLLVLDGSNKIASFGGGVNIGGNVIITGDTATGSDIRFKDVIKDHRIALESIAQAPLFTFKWNDREDDTIHLGTSAQYWECVAPWLVKGTDFKVLDYSTLGVAIGISLANKTVNLEERVKILEKENEQLKKQIRYGS